MAPASRARSTSSRWLKAVRTMTGAIRDEAICSAAARPSRTGIWMSRMTRAGASPRAPAAAEGGRAEARREPGRGDLLGGRQTVEDGHLDVEDDQVGRQLPRPVDGGLAVTGLGDDHVSLLLEHLPEVEADEGLVLADEDPGRRAAPGRRGSGRHRPRRRPRIPPPRASP